MPQPTSLVAETLSPPVINRTPATVAFALLQGMRPKQWVKNGTVFLPLLFSVNQSWRPSDFGQLWHFVALSIAAAACFSAISSGEYLLNDLMDRESDRQHPKKRFRPLA
ncbi:MAG: decaprenyl-phosphate phosphoribosyltransferase, partial [Chloroflexi bacterium]|nr:decaprenyl-phosphate phosphoribosyltransferase [Chloroflexota bacterium]